MSLLTLVSHVKCMPCQPSHFIQLEITKDALLDR
jgi:hypothetical protein